MSMLSHQIEQLKDLRFRMGTSDKHSSTDWTLINGAIDTIESLSAKLSAANMERSERYYGGGWILCKDRLPKEKGWYLLYAKGQRPFVGYFKGKTFPLNNHYHEIIAWRELPQPPKEE